MSEWFDLEDADEEAIATFMCRVASLRIPDRGSRVPVAGELWGKARLIERWDAARRAQRPLDIMQRVEIAGGLVAAGLLVYLSLLG